MGCYNSCIVDASPDRVWDVLRDFHDLSWAKGVVDAVEKAGPKAADQIGAQRVLNGPGGGVGTTEHEYTCAG